MEVKRKSLKNKFIKLDIEKDEPGSSFFYVIAMRVVLGLKQLMLRDRHRRELAREQLIALKEAWALAEQAVSRSRPASAMGSQLG